MSSDREHPRRAVQDVINRIAWAADEANAEALAELLADDIVIEAPAQGLVFGPGRGEYLAFLETAAARRAAAGETGRHLMTNIVVDVTDEHSATARSYATQVIISTDGSHRIGGFGLYDDCLVQDSHGWRLASRRLLSATERTSIPT